MALTATATPDVLMELKELGNPICEVASVNKRNISYFVHPIQSTG
jgi:superfamily II DNA helicase RecQ